MNVRRREFLRFAAAGFVQAGASAAWLCRSSANDVDHRGIVNVRSFGAVGDGKALDTPAVNRAIAAVAAAGSGTVHFPPGAYTATRSGSRALSRSILRRAQPFWRRPPADTTRRSRMSLFERYQDFGHNHWHNSLIWGEDTSAIVITQDALQLFIALHITVTRSGSRFSAGYRQDWISLEPLQIKTRRRSRRSADQCRTRCILAGLRHRISFHLNEAKDFDPMLGKVATPEWSDHF